MLTAWPICRSSPALRLSFCPKSRYLVNSRTNCRLSAVLSAFIRVHRRLIALPRVARELHLLQA